MSKQGSNITQENLIEWLCSTGYLFPRNEVELSRLEKLHPKIDRKEHSIDPFAIIKDSRDRRNIQLQFEDDDDNKDYSELRMAARKNKNLPGHIIDKMKQKHNGGDKS